MSTEALLVLTLAALYLGDSLVWLRPDEGVLVAGLRHWHARFGATSLRMRGREPYLAHPLTPHAAVLRLRWSMAGNLPLHTDRSLPPPLPPALRRLGVLAWAVWLSLFVLLPLALFGWAPWTPLAAAIVAYAQVLLTAVALWRWRQPLQMSRRSAALLALECLLCPPCAANAVRRVARLQPQAEDFLSAAWRAVPAGQRAPLARQCVTRLNERLDAIDEDAAERKTLLACRAILAQAAEGDEA